MKFPDTHLIDWPIDVRDWLRMAIEDACGICQELPFFRENISILSSERLNRETKRFNCDYHCKFFTNPKFKPYLPAVLEILKTDQDSNSITFVREHVCESIEGKDGYLNFNLKPSFIARQLESYWPSPENKSK